MATESDIFVQLQNDDVFRQFLESDVDAKALASRAIQGLAISQQLAKLADGINLLDRQLHSQVSSHHEDLLSQAIGVETLEGVLQMMQTRIQSLLAAIERIRSKITDPYTRICTRTAQLRRLQETCDLLRRIIRILYLSKRLHGQLQGSVREITKAAQSLNELDNLSIGVDLTGIEVIEADRRFVKQARKEVETQAQKMLETGMETQNQTQVATALQVFHNLGNLQPMVSRVMDTCHSVLQESIRDSLDVTVVSQQKKGVPGKASMPAPGNTAAYRATLWANLEKLMDSIHSACLQAQHLQKVLSRKRDPVTHICFIEHLAKAKGGAVNIMTTFWRDTTTMLTDEFANAVNDSSFLKQAFEGEYPKLLRLYNDLWRRLQQFVENLSEDTGADMAADVYICDEESEQLEDGQSSTKRDEEEEEEFDAEMALKNSLAPFEKAYLSRSLSRLFDPINLVFAAGSLNAPTMDEVIAVVKTISSELGVASVDNSLSISVARNVAKTVQLFCVKSEQLLCTDGEASQVIGPATPGQNRNTAVVNSLYQLHQEVTKVIGDCSEFPPVAITAIQAALEGVLVLMRNSIQPLLSSISDALEAIVLTLHNEDFSQQTVGENASSSSEPQCSLYMRELQEFISRAHNLYLTGFNCVDFIMDAIHPMACRCIELFVRHASLIRPLGDAGKMRLATDFAHMEMGIGPLCRKVADLGKPYKMLRATRPLLFQASEHVAVSAAIGEIIPYSTALHLLFGRAPAELRPPHEVAKWSLSRYSQWLEDHPSEKDRLTLIKGSLESYVQQVRMRDGKQFADIYPIMLDLLQHGLQNCA